MLVATVWSLRLKFLVNDVEAKSISSALHFGDQITQLLDRLDLLLQVVTLNVVGQLSIVMAGSNFVQIQEGLHRKKKLVKTG